jgi:hypothetical protein
MCGRVSALDGLVTLCGAQAQSLAFVCRHGLACAHVPSSSRIRFARTHTYTSVHCTQPRINTKHINPGMGHGCGVLPGGRRVVPCGTLHYAPFCQDCLVCSLLAICVGGAAARLRSVGRRTCAKAREQVCIRADDTPKNHLQYMPLGVCMIFSSTHGQ